MVKIVVLGGGFAGSKAATLIEKKIPDAEVTVVEGRDVLVHKVSVEL